MFRATLMSFDLMQGVAAASVATAVTLMHRLPMLAAAVVDPTPERTREAATMVGEKVDAAFEGGFAALSESMRLAGSLASGRVMPHQMFEGALSLTTAASRPAMTRVQANAKRLSQR